MNAHLVGARVRQMREQIGITQAELAEAADITAATLSTLETGGDRHGVTLKTLVAVAQALGVPVAVLLGEQPLPLHWPVDRVFWRQVAREIDALRKVA